MDDFLQLTRNVRQPGSRVAMSTTLDEGTPVTITQSLGGSYTIHVATGGGLFRIAGKDADALGRETEQVKVVTEGPFEEENVWGQLREVYDPEIPVNIVDLGLIYGMQASDLPEGGKVVVQMTLTAPGCGMGPALAAEARQRISTLPGVADADVILVWDHMGSGTISPAGRSKLGID